MVREDQYLAPVEKLPEAAAAATAAITAGWFCI